MRAAAAEAVAALPAPGAEAVAAILPLLDDADAAARAGAERALGSLGAEARGALTALRRLADADPSPEVRALAKGAVEQIQ